MRRRAFLENIGCLAMLSQFPMRASAQASSSIDSILDTEDVFGYILRQKGGMDLALYRQILGAANEFKEGDQIVGVAAKDEPSRQNARRLLSRTLISDISSNPPFVDQQQKLTSRMEPAAALHGMTLGELRQFLLEKSEQEIHLLKGSLSSDVIACVVKLMSNADLIQVGAKIFNPMPASNLGARGYLGARIQPNSPTDNLDDILWQVFDGFSYAVGDFLLGTNPVSSELESVAAIELKLREVLVTFGIEDCMPHCVLSHIDVQAAVEAQHPGSTALWFQSIAGNDTANQTFDLTLEKLTAHAQSQAKQMYGLYFETGQGADFTNGHAHGLDMLIHESRKYGLARALTQMMSQTRASQGITTAPWVHVNDVAGFIGPEVFRTKEQLVRCCLEDIVMGKLHGLTIGLDVCSTLHMDISLHDLDWCLDQVVPACPAYLMALPTKIDPMLGYLTTGFQDHVRLREKHGLQVNDRMWKFFQDIEIIDDHGRPTRHFGDPIWVYQQFCRRLGDQRSDEVVRNEGIERIAKIRERGVFIAEGHGKEIWDLKPALNTEIHRIYEDAKKCIWQQWDDSFIQRLPDPILLATQSQDRTDYILHPTSGEQLSVPSRERVLRLRADWDQTFDTVIVVSDGLNATALMAPEQLMPLVEGLKQGALQSGYRVAPQWLLLHSGRVRAGYRIGELLFQGIQGKRTILHVIGERPGSGHHTLSVYMTTADGSTWSVPDRVDHNITKVVSGIATTALLPVRAAEACTAILRTS